MENSKNVILIILDATRQDHLSCYGYKRNTTPNIDKLSKEALIFSNAFTVSPWTLPSTASIFTGLYPSHHNVGGSSPFLNGDYITLSEYFKTLKYETLCITNNNWLNEHSKFNRGFDQFLKVWQFFQISEDPIGRRGIEREEYSLKDVFSEIKKGNIFKNLVNSFYGAFVHKKGDYGAKKLNTLFKNWYIKRESKKPFFACLFYLEPHQEYRPQKRFAEKYLPQEISYNDAMKINQDAWAYICGKVKMDKKDFEILTSLYDAEINYLDYRLGELFQFLKDEGVYEESIIIITADHGENLGDHGLMDHQYCLYDSLLKIPLIIKYPNNEYTGEIKNIVENIDIFPILKHYMNGKNMYKPKCKILPTEEISEDKRSAFSEYLEPQPNIKVMKKKYGCKGIEKYDRQLKAIRTGNHKLIISSRGEKYLYNIENDPLELENIFATEKDETVENLEKELFKKVGEFKNNFIKRELDKKIKKRLERLGYL